MRGLVVYLSLLLSLSAVLAPMLVSAQSSAVPMQPGVSYDPAACNGVTFTGGLYVCQQPPTPVPTPTPSPTPATAYIDGIPVCADDDVTWHSTVQRNPDNSIKCTFGHEHGDDPNSLNATFGPMGAWWNSGHEHDISYPWQTPNENEAKHTAYKIVTRGSDAQPLLPYYSDGANNYLKALRATYHVDGAKGIMTHEHSFGFEGQLCSPDGVCGIARWGGVQDRGAAYFDEASTGGVTCIEADQEYPTPSTDVCANPPGVNVDQLRFTGGRPGGPRRDQTWYGDSRAHHITPNTNGLDLSFGIIAGHVWSPIKPGAPLDASSSDPAVRGDYPPHYRQTPYTAFNVDDWHHNDSVEVSALGGRIYGNVGTRITASGYTDRYGNIITGCASMGPDCVPFSLVNVPAGTFGFRDLEYSQSTGRPNQVLKYDVTNPATGRSLLIWPN